MTRNIIQRSSACRAAIVARLLRQGFGDGMTLSMQHHAYLEESKCVELFSLFQRWYIYSFLHYSSCVIARRPIVG